MLNDLFIPSRLTYFLLLSCRVSVIIPNGQIKKETREVKDFAQTTQQIGGAHIQA